MTQVKAKFSCNYITEFDGNKNVFLHAVYEGEENKEWATSTPGGNLQMTISTDAPASEFFEQGKDYYLTFEAAE